MKWKLILLVMVLTGCREVFWERAVGTVVAVELTRTVKVDDEYLFYSTYQDTTECVISFTVGDIPVTDRLSPAYCEVHAVGDRIDVIKITATDPKIGMDQVRTYYLIQRPDVPPEYMARIVKQWGYPKR